MKVIRNIIVATVLVLAINILIGFVISVAVH